MMRSEAEELSPEEAALADAADLMARAKGPVFNRAALRADKLFRNLLSYPQEVRFRTLKLTNPVIRRDIVACPGAVQLLCASGAVVSSSSGEDSGTGGLASSVLTWPQASEQQVFIHSSCLPAPEARSCAAGAVGEHVTAGGRAQEWRL
jgi:hypothetical protein